MELSVIKNLCNGGALRWTNHMMIRLVQRNININDVITALLNGAIIEQYPEDYPYPSCLIMGMTDRNEHLHVVCGVDDEELWLVTAYYPNPEEWTDNFKVRREIEE